MAERLGVFTKEFERKKGLHPKVWIHAVSVGEAGSAAAIIEALKKRSPGISVILSTATFYGHKFAEERVGSDAICVYSPIDFPFSVKRALRFFEPEALVCLETEIWPNFLIAAKRMGIRTAIVNGRISARSMKRYLKIRPLIRETLRHVDSFSMIREEDSKRIEKLGAEKEKIKTNGNAKYDVLLKPADKAAKKRMERLYGTKEEQVVFIAGSTRSDEEEIVLDVYERIIRFFPDAMLIIFPRHIKRSRKLLEKVGNRGFSCQLRSELDENLKSRTAPVVICDTIGELCAAYGIATIVFCGGSLAPKGGHNVMEPAAWGKLLFYGPSMEDFLDAKSLLDKTGGGLQVKDGDDLAEKALHYLLHPDEAGKIKEAARTAVRLNRSAASKHALVISDLLDRSRLGQLN